MRSFIHSEHWNDANGNPAGGSTFGNGFAISWQNGPLGRCTCNQVPGHTPHLAGCGRREPNGAFVEDVIQAAIDRIAYYQDSRFACSENAEALRHLIQARQALEARTSAREARSVEGTHAA